MLHLNTFHTQRISKHLWILMKKKICLVMFYVSRSYEKRKMGHGVCGDGEKTLPKQLNRWKTLAAEMYLRTETSHALKKIWERKCSFADRDRREKTARWRWGSLSGSNLQLRCSSTSVRRLTSASIKKAPRALSTVTKNENESRELLSNQGELDMQPINGICSPY